MYYINYQKNIFILFFKLICQVRLTVIVDLVASYRLVGILYFIFAVYYERQSVIMRLIDSVSSLEAHADIQMFVPCPNTVPFATVKRFRERHGHFRIIVIINNVFDRVLLEQRRLTKF
jgi:hypothetical protein